MKSKKATIFFKKKSGVYEQKEVQNVALEHDEVGRPLLTWEDGLGGRSSWKPSRDSTRAVALEKWGLGFPDLEPDVWKDFQEHESLMEKFLEERIGQGFEVLVEIRFRPLAPEPTLSERLRMDAESLKSFGDWRFRNLAARVEQAADLLEESERASKEEPLSQAEEDRQAFRDAEKARR